MAYEEQKNVKTLNELTNWINLQKERNYMAEEVSFSSYKFEAILDILEESVEGLHALNNHGLAERRIPAINQALNTLTATSPQG